MLYGIYGASGFGRQVMPVARKQLKSQGISEDRLVFVDDNPPGEKINGHRALTYSDFIHSEARERFIVLAIGNSSIRQRLAVRCQQDRIRFWAVYADNIVIMDDVEIGEGAILKPFVTLTSNIRIGRHFHANLYSHISHDCIIGDYVTFAPGVRCNGNVVIEDNAYIGSGAIIKQGKPGAPLVVGRGATVGMGAVVTKSVPDGVTVVGNPAKIIRHS